MASKRRPPGRPALSGVEGASPCTPHLRVEQWLRRKIQKRERMKTCPQCDTGYPDSHTTCPIHGLLLNEIRELRPGMVIHKTYRIVRKLGQGGMGVVYLAQHIQMGEQRALKFLSPELSRDEALTSRFLREVRTLRQVRNRNVVDCGDLEAAEDDSLFFSMEFVDGPDLRAFLNNAHFHTDESIDVLKGSVPQVPRSWGPGNHSSSTNGCPLSLAFGDLGLFNSKFAGAPPSAQFHRA